MNLNPQTLNPIWYSYAANVQLPLLNRDLAEFAELVKRRDPALIKLTGDTAHRHPKNMAELLSTFGEHFRFLYGELGYRGGFEELLPEDVFEKVFKRIVSSPEDPLASLPVCSGVYTGTEEDPVWVVPKSHAVRFKLDALGAEVWVPAGERSRAYLNPPADFKGPRPKQTHGFCDSCYELYLSFEGMRASPINPHWLDYSSRVSNPAQ